MYVRYDMFLQYYSSLYTYIFVPGSLPGVYSSVWGGAAVVFVEREVRPEEREKVTGDRV